MSADASSKHPSLEKTDSLVFKTQGDPAPALPRGESPSDTDVLKQEVEKKGRAAAALASSVEELKAALEAARRDFAGQRAEHALELKTLKEVLQKAHVRVGDLERELSQERQASKQLKAQILSLQYHLNLWGVPVASCGGSPGRDAHAPDADETFFLPISPIAGGADPVLPVLRGDLLSFYFPNVLHFLANSSLEGVLTVVSEGIIAKLYLEKGILRFAGWNNRDPDLRLSTLLGESGLVPREALAEVERDRLYDLELANLLISEKKTAAQTVREGLREHARVILGFLFHLKRGSFLFQPGQVQRRRELQFRLSITDLLLKTAAEMDEKTRVAMTGSGK